LALGFLACSGAEIRKEKNKKIKITKNVKKKKNKN